MIIRYQPLVDGDGLALKDGALAAYVGERLVASSKAPSGVDLKQLMESYRLLRLLPDVSFSHVAPHTDDYVVDVNDATVTPRDMSGLMTVAGTKYPWDAMVVVDGIFADRSAYGPWLGAEMSPRSVRGWAYRTPGALVFNDPVLAARLRLALQSVVCSIIAGRVTELPAAFRLTNEFGMANPPVPPVVAPDVDALRASRRDASLIGNIRRMDVSPDGDLSA